MSLIQCPECGKEISDKSEKCMYCGYSINTRNICKINGVEYDLSFLLDESYSILYKVRDLIQISNSDITHVKPAVEKIVHEKVIPSFLNLPLKENDNYQKQSTVPHCPTCSSINIRKISGTSKMASVALWGIFSQKVKKTYHCNNCGYEW